MFHFSKKSVWSTCLVIFILVGTKVGVWKTASFLSSCIPGIFYSIALEAIIMMNVFYL